MKRVYRSQRDKKLFGVCGGLAEAFGIDSTIVRIVVVITTVFASGALVPIYIIAAMVMPKEPMFPPPDNFGPHWNGHHGNGHHSHTHGSTWGTQHAAHKSQPKQGFYPPGESSRGASIDEMMEDVEKKALAREIEQLKARLAKYEQNNKGDA